MRRSWRPERAANTASSPARARPPPRVIRAHGRSPRNLPALPAGGLGLKATSAAPSQQTGSMAKNQVLRVKRPIARLPAVLPASSSPTAARGRARTSAPPPSARAASINAAQPNPARAVRARAAEPREGGARPGDPDAAADQPGDHRAPASQPRSAGLSARRAARSRKKSPAGTSARAPEQRDAGEREECEGQQQHRRAYPAHGRPPCVHRRMNCAPRGRGRPASASARARRTRLARPSPLCGGARSRADRARAQSARVTHSQRSPTSRICFIPARARSAPPPPAAAQRRRRGVVGLPASSRQRADGGASGAKPCSNARVSATVKPAACAIRITASRSRVPRRSAGAR